MSGAWFAKASIQTTENLPFPGPKYRYLAARLLVPASGRRKKAAFEDAQAMALELWLMPMMTRFLVSVLETGEER